ncbi:hypothetical protein FF38_13250 [Lucilia cuprina]|uniref:Uncharacterized protein n=1 Tax=Lucilia cuprina TaxID=7375 RepID=A0A0L0CP93_LUCCU|nr:hypothetical protein FF38_13250 [Lucilia cuprina]
MNTQHLSNNSVLLTICSAMAILSLKIALKLNIFKQFIVPTSLLAKFITEFKSKKVFSNSLVYPLATPVEGGFAGLFDFILLIYLDQMSVRGFRNLGSFVVTKYSQICCDDAVRYFWFNTNSTRYFFSGTARGNNDGNNEKKEETRRMILI